MAKKKGDQNYSRPNFWGFLRDVLITSMNRGQLLLTAFVLILLIFIIKLPQNELMIFASKVLHVFKDWHLFGWFIAIFTTFGWFFGAKRQRFLHTDEMRRISEEKRQLQQKLSDKRLPSSN